MSDNESDEITHHAMLVTWGQFAQSMGLILAVENVPLHQKTVTDRPQTRILEFLVAVLAGLEHLKDLSRAAHPIDQDGAVAKAWLQSAWADYSGVSRTLSALRQEEAEQVAGVLDELTQPILAAEVMKALQIAGRLTYDGHLTGRAVSNGSTSYPNAGYGHMDDAIRLGYQAAMVSMHSPSHLVAALDPVNYEKPYTEELEGGFAVVESTPPGPGGEKRLTPGYRAMAATVVNLPEPLITYASWFSYRTADFVSENREIYRGIRTTRALFPEVKLRFVADSGWTIRKCSPMGIRLA